MVRNVISSQLLFHGFDVMTAFSYSLCLLPLWLKKLGLKFYISVFPKVDNIPPTCRWKETGHTFPMWPIGFSWFLHRAQSWVATWPPLTAGSFILWTKAFMWGSISQYPWHMRTASCTIYTQRLFIAVCWFKSQRTWEITERSHRFWEHGVAFSDSTRNLLWKAPPSAGIDRELSPCGLLS